MEGDYTDKHHITQIFGIPDSADIDFFDANLEHDLPVFIDPFLIKNSPNSTEATLFERFGDYFRYAYDVSTSLETFRMPPKQFAKLLAFKEPKNINMGYTETSNAGHGTNLTKKLISFFMESAARKYVRDTKYFPDHMYNPVSLQAFTDGIGYDGISDISANLIMDYLISYTLEQAKKWNIPLKKDIHLDTDGFDFETHRWKGGGYYELPENPLRRGEALILVPRRLLRGFEELNENTVSQVFDILRADSELSWKFADLLEKTVKEVSVDEIRQIFLQEGTVHYRYLQNLESERSQPYDFDKDFLGLLADKDYSDYFDDHKFGDVNSCATLKTQVEEYLDEVRLEFEVRDGWKDAWKKTPKGTPTPQTEPVIGRKIRGMGYAYFRHLNEVTFIPEAGTGNGLSDFYVVYKDCKVIIELKLLSNSSPKGEPPLFAYLQGISRQLPNYVQSSRAKHAYYVTGQHWDGVAHGKATNHTPRITEIEALRLPMQTDLRAKVASFDTLTYQNIKMMPHASASKL